MLKSSSNDHFGHGKNVAIEIKDNTKYEPNNLTLNITPSRVHVIENGGNINLFAVSNHAIVATTKSQIYYFNTSFPAPQNYVPYNLLRYSQDIKGFENTTYILLSNRNSSLIGLGSDLNVNLYKIEFEKPDIRCRSPDDNQYRAVVIQLLRSNCSKSESLDGVCLSTQKFLVGKQMTSFPKSFVFPNISMPRIKIDNKYINKLIALSDLTIEGRGTGVKYALVLVAIIFVIFVVCMVFGKKDRSNHMNRGGNSRDIEGVEFSSRGKRGHNYSTVDDDTGNDESEQIIAD